MNTHTGMSHWIMAVAAKRVFHEKKRLANCQARGTISTITVRMDLIIPANSGSKQHMCVTKLKKGNGDGFYNRIIIAHAPLNPH